MDVIRKAKFTSLAYIDGLTYGNTYNIVDAYGGEFIGVIDDFGEKIIVTDFLFD